MKLIITTDADLNAIKAAILAVDCNAVISVAPRTDRDLLLDTIRENPMDFAQGYLCDGELNQLCELTDTISLELTNQVRYNGADFMLCGSDGDLYELIDEQHYNKIQDMWSPHLCGDMLASLDGIVLLMLFGTQPSDDVIDALLTGRIECLHLDEEQTQKIFSDYPTFVNEVLEGKCHDVDYEVGIGSDS